MNEKKSTKKRNWAFVCYPESLPTDWVDKLQQTGLQVAISPLHDKDLNPTGELKKPHYHVILCYSGPTSYNVVKNLTEEMNAPIPVALEQVRGYYRYLTHKDNPEKAQYNENDIKTLNGFNISDFVELTKSEVFSIKVKVQTLICEKEITEYAVLCDYLLHNNLMAELEVAQNHTIFFNTYIRSKRHYALRGKPYIDPGTGEVID